MQLGRRQAEGEPDELGNGPDARLVDLPVSQADEALLEPRRGGVYGVRRLEPEEQLGETLPRHEEHEADDHAECDASARTGRHGFTK